MSVSLDSLEAGMTVNFKLKDAITLYKTTTFNNVFIEGVITRRSVQRYGSSAQSIYSACRPFLGTGYNVPLDDWKFVVITTTGSANPTVIPLEAIDSTTLAVSSVKDIIVTISSVDTSECKKILDILTSYGYENVAITTN